MVQQAHQLLRDGDLDGARRALVEFVRANPANDQARMFLFQLLAVAGEWDKARTQLATLAKLAPEAQMLGVAYGQAIDAEAVRAAVFAGKAAPDLLAHSDWAVGLVEAIGHFAAGRDAEGEAARDRAFDLAPDMPGELDGTRFGWIADADSRFGPACEAIIGGRYGIVPFDVVARIESEGPRDLRDIVWYPVQIHFRAGQSVAAMLPTRYPGSEASADTAERLARATGWTDTAWGQAGSGVHLWSLDGEDDREILSVRNLIFD